jgi:excinuclease ABC subunit C
MKLSDKVRKKLKELPDKPGVYMMRDRRGRVIYIGKAASLRKRVQSYFRQGTLRSADPKLRGLIRSIEDFDYLELRTEAEATLTESRFIKDYRPRYNVLLKDDKRFILLKVNRKVRFPRFQTVRLRKSDGADYFGPYTSSGAARAALEFIERRFGLRVCRPVVPGPEHYKHCLNDVIRYCSAPCVGKISEDEYNQRVDEACAFLKGERPAYLKEIRAAMEQEAEAMHFEKAAALRDTLLLLHRAIKERAKVRRSPEMQAEDAALGLKEIQQCLGLPEPPRVIETFDISNISGTLAVASMVCAVEGLPRPQRYRHFRIKTVEGPDDPAMMHETILRRYRRVLDEKQALPDIVMVDGGITQVRAAKAALASLFCSLPVVGLAKRYEELVRDVDGTAETLRLPEDSPGLRVLQRIRDEAHRFAITYHRSLRSRRIRESVLDDIPGIGAARKRQLLAHFGSVNRLRKASEAEIAALPGFGSELARLIAESL